MPSSGSMLQTQTQLGTPALLVCGADPDADADVVGCVDLGMRVG